MELENQNNQRRPLGAKQKRTKEQTSKALPSTIKKKGRRRRKKKSILSNQTTSKDTHKKRRKTSVEKVQTYHVEIAFIVERRGGVGYS